MPDHEADLPHRRSIRLRGYDYSQVGAYFVTICTHQARPLFGEIVDGAMLLNEHGKVVEEEWLRTGTIRPNVILDAYVIMPNHMHGILVITENSRQGENTHTITQVSHTDAAPLRSPSQTIGAIVRGFKAATTRKINLLPDTSGIPIWHRNYYEHVIRNDADMNRIRLYIVNNPVRWEDDKYYSPLRMTADASKRKQH